MADTASAEDDNHPRAQPWAEVALHATLRGLQIVLGLTVIGLYGSGLASQIKPAGYDQPKWVRYGETMPFPHQRLLTFSHRPMQSLLQPSRRSRRASTSFRG